MYQIKVKTLWQDTCDLYEEYSKEDKKNYEILFGSLFNDIDCSLVLALLPRLPRCVHDIFIFINRYPNPVETFFISSFDMKSYARELREDSIIRKYTKLCFYIEENIKPYSSIDMDIPKQI